MMKLRCMCSLVVKTIWSDSFSRFVWYMSSFFRIGPLPHFPFQNETETTKSYSLTIEVKERGRGGEADLGTSRKPTVTRPSRSGYYGAKTCCHHFRETSLTQSIKTVQEHKSIIAKLQAHNGATDLARPRPNQSQKPWSFYAATRWCEASVACLVAWWRRLSWTVACKRPAAPSIIPCLSVWFFCSSAQ